MTNEHGNEHMSYLWGYGSSSHVAVTIDKENCETLENQTRGKKECQSLM